MRSGGSTKIWWMMSKINSFWISEQAPIDNLESIQEYLKPRTKQELLELFSPKTPSVEEPQGELQQLDSDEAKQDELLELYGVTPQEFAQSVVDEPELWTEEELEKLYSVLAGQMDPKEISDLAFEYITGGKNKKPDPYKSHVIQDEIQWDFGDDFLEGPVTSPDPGINLNTPIDLTSVGEWWKSKGK